MHQLGVDELQMARILCKEKHYLIIVQTIDFVGWFTLMSMLVSTTSILSFSLIMGAHLHLVDVVSV